MAEPKAPVVDEEDYLEIANPEDVFSKPEPVLNGGARPVSTVWEMAECCMFANGESNCFGVREYLKDKKKASKGDGFGAYQWITYGTLHDLCEYAGSALVRMGTKKNELCAIFGCNSPEFIVSMLGAARQGCIPVPLPFNCSASELANVLKRTGLRVMMCNSAVFYRFVAACEILRREDVNLTVQVVIILRGIPGMEVPAPPGSIYEPTIATERDDGIPEEYIEKQKERFKWRTVLSWRKFLSTGKKHKRPSLVTSGNDIFAVFQTSGVTGEAKCVMLSNRAVLSAIETVCSHPDRAKLFPDPHEMIGYNYAPLAHISGMIFALSLLRLGGSIGFESSQDKTIKRTVSDMTELHPTIINSVPEMWRQLRNAAEGSAEGGFLQRKLMKYAATKSEEEKKPAEKKAKGKGLIGSLSRGVLGGHVRSISVCGAYFSPVILKFITKSFDRVPIQVYGQTEYCGCGLFCASSGSKDTSNESFRSTSSGFCPPGTRIRLVTVGDGARYSIRHSPPTGEIFIYSPSMFAGYLGDRAGTEEVLDDDRWFKTGDVGQLNPDGSISVIERLNDDYKLSNGAFAHTAMLNEAYGMSTLCQHVFTYVHKEYNFVVAVVAVDVKALDDCAMLPSSAREISAKARANPKSSIVKKLLEMPEIVDLYLREFARIAEENQFNESEIVRGVILDGREWNAENGLLTSTGKMCKLELLRRFQDNLDRLAYDIVNKPPTAELK